MAAADDRSTCDVGRQNPTPRHPSPGRYLPGYLSSGFSLGSSAARSALSLAASAA
jgi:hypothetical protein